MFLSIWNFIKRHKRKIVITGAIAGGIYYASRYARHKLQDFQENETAECLSRARKQHHFDSNQRTCNMTVMSMLPGIRDALMQLLNSEELTEELKARPANKLELWEELKILSFTRTVSAIYTVSMVVVVLRVQLNVIGGYMYQDSMLPTDSMQVEVNSNAVAPPDIQGQYLASIQYLVHEGLQGLVAAVRKEVEKNVGKMTLKENVSLLKLQTVINHIRQEMEHKTHNGYYDGAGSRLCAFMLPPQTHDQAVQLSKKEVMYRKIMQETQDMIDSGDFHAVMTSCLDTGFNRMLDKLAEFYKPATQNGTVFSPTEVSLPLAKVIPVMNGLIHSVCGDTPNSLVQDLLLKEQVRDFAANVYEAFCQPEPQQSP